MTESEETIIFNDLFRKTYAKLFFYARNVLGNETDAEDVLEEVFLNLWNKRKEINWDGHINGFLYKAVLTRSINMLKKRKHEPERIEYITNINAKRIEEMESVWGNPQYETDQKDLSAAINQAVLQLPGKCKKVFELSYLEGLHNREIADKMNISVRTVETHLYTATRILRTKLLKLRQFVKILL